MMNKPSAWMVSGCLALALTAAARAEDHPVVFWRLKALGIEDETAAKVEEVLRKEIGRLPGFRLLPEGQVRSALRERAELSGCQGDSSCLGELGKAAGAGSVVSGVLGTLGDMFSLDIKYVDAVSGTEVRRIAQTWSGEADSLIEVMRQVATRLLRPQAYSGQLALQVNAPGVKVYIDGDFIGRTPLDEPLRLTPGRHALKLACAGFKDFERFVDVYFDRTVPVHLDLEGSGVSGVVSASRVEDRFSIGIKGGLVSNLSALIAPQASLELGFRLPLWEGRLAILLESGAYGSMEDRAATTDALGRVSVRAETLVWPVQLQVILRLLPDYPFSPYLGGGGGFFVVWQNLKPEGLPAQGFRDGVFGFQALAGLEYRLGPGVVLLEARYQHVQLSASGSEGGVEGLLGGLGVQLGYRFLL